MKPVFFHVGEEINIASNLPALIHNGLSDKEAEILLSYPTVYIHYWPGTKIEYTDKNGLNHSKQLYNVYGGRSLF